MQALYRIREAQRRQGAALADMRDRHFVNVVYQTLWSRGGAIKKKVRVIRKAKKEIKNRRVLREETKNANRFIKITMYFAMLGIVKSSLMAISLARKLKNW